MPPPGGMPPGMQEQLKAEKPKNLQDVPRYLKEVVGGTLDRAAVDRVSREHLADFADFRLCLDAKRAAWIRARLFAE